MRFLSSLFASGTTHRILASNPFAELPKDRETSILNSLATKKTIDNNLVISRDKGMEINRKMLLSKSGKDRSYDVFVLLAMTGARIQEIAGLRGCDFVKRRAGGKDYFCIQITAWSERGHGALTGMSGGLKTTASVRVVPLPSCAHELWERYADENNKNAAFPRERPTNPEQPWGGNLRKRMSDKCGKLQSKCWRETMINNATNAGISYRAAEMVTGKTGESTVVQYTSDDLVVMQQAVEINADALQIEKWLNESAALGSES
jgi:integrase